jgi:hypothetical protein
MMCNGVRPAAGFDVAGEYKDVAKFAAGRAEELGAAQAGESVGIHGPVHQPAVFAYCALTHEPGADAGVGGTVLLSVVTITLVVKAIVVDVLVVILLLLCSD